MNQIFIPPMSKAKEASMSKRLDLYLSQIRKNVVEAKEILKESEKLKRSGDRAYIRAKKAVESLANY